MARRSTGHGGLTERDHFWLGHLERQAAGAETSKAYAGREGVSIYALYQARKRLVSLGAWPASAVTRKRVRSSSSASAPLFTRVAVSASAPSVAAACRLRLASGAVIEWSVAPAVEVLAALAVQIAAPR